MTTEAEKMAPLWRLQARLTDTHFGFIAADWRANLRTPFAYPEVFEVLQEIAHIEGRVTWDAMGRAVDDIPRV